MIQYKYKFSIIMSVWNTSEYIEEAIDSLINQTLDFKENVQLILVNDGSTDNSGEICKKYMEKYEDNIEYYEKENGGLSSARNFGLDFVQGEYVNFFDPDDILSSGTLESVLNFFNENKEKVKIAGLVVEYFENKTGIHPRYAKFGKETTVINLDESPQNYILSSAATFYKSSLLENVRFDTNLVIAEDLYMNSKLYIQNRHIGIIGHDEAVYYYRKRKETVEKSLSAKGKEDPKIFTFSTKYIYEGFIETLAELNMDMPEYMKYILMEEVKKKGKVLNVTKDEDKKDFLDLSHEILQKIEDECIVKYYDTNHMVKVAFFALKYKWDPKNIVYKIQNNRLYANGIHVGIPYEAKLGLSNIEILEKEIKLMGVYNDMLPCNEDTSIRFKNSNLKTYTAKLYPSDNNFFENRTLGLTFNTPCKYEINLPIADFMSYKPILKVAGLEIPMKFVMLKKKFAVQDYVSQDEPYKLFSSKNSVDLTNYNITVSKISLMSKWLYEFKRIKYIKNNYESSCLYRILSSMNKKYILMNDRPMAGDDNAQALFEYICKNDKKLAKNTYFVIDKTSGNYKKLKKIGKVLAKDSIRHKIKFMNTKMIVASHFNFYNPFSESETMAYRDLWKYKYTFLQHGVIINDVHKPINKCNSNINLFVTSTLKEYEEVTTPKYMYSEKEVILTGLPRFDKLQRKNEKLVVIAPTWRTFLSGPINQQGFHEMLDDFGSSDYYKVYSSLLLNEKLQKALKNKGYKMLFLLHPGFTLYADYFKKFESDMIEVKNVEEMIYSDIFARLDLLITDYSSIIFDVAYLKKPMLFYQFDKNEYFSNHYKPGYFSYENDGFGKVITKEKDLINEVITLVNNDCKMPKQYVKRVENTFKYLDKNNCKRVLKEIRNILE